MIAPGRRPLFVLLDSAGEKVINWRTAEKQHARVRVPLLPEWEAPVMATVGCRFRCDSQLDAIKTAADSDRAPERVNAREHHGVQVRLSVWRASLQEA